ncbi:MAG: isoleucine--tRNA ligase, partial [Chitinophagales bacterium]
MQNYRVERKGGWDTHGLPVELSVEKKLGITKEDIGKKISVAEYNRLCREQVMTFKNQWEELTDIMGYWVDMDDPYLTFDTSYIETLWYLLKQLYEKGYLYKGYTIQPYSPAAGTGLSSHELNQPGTYKPVKDTTIVAMFKLIANTGEIPASAGMTSPHVGLFAGHDEVFFLAWTTTPWTLPSNCALAVGKEIIYVQIETFNQYTQKLISVILAEERIPAFFKEENKVHELNPENLFGWKLLSSFKGKELAGLRYEQLMPYQQPETGDNFRVVIGDFVTTEDGTGIVHIAPSFGADDFRVAKQNNIGTLTLVDKQGKFIDGVGELSGRYVKNYTDDPKWENPDITIAIKLKESNRAFKVEKYEHNYPHCWRTDKPVIYYPLDSWFIKTTAAKERLIELNKTINWKPRSTGEGRFGQWLENLVDWNLSRSRYWGTPLPIWRTDDGAEEICIGSIEELKEEYEKAFKSGINDGGLLPLFEKELGMRNEELNRSNFPLGGPGGLDLHKPFVDDIILVSPSGKPMRRESDLIDVWFDSGAMPYAQLHYPFENKDVFKNKFPADYIAEGVDQTRGWFFTLHVIATLISDSIAYKNVLSHGLVLDKNGNKMSKRLNNSIDPFNTIYKYGADATRWYMISNTQPWDNVKFDIEGLVEVQRKFFGTLFNTYSFFSLYANVDEFNFSEKEIDISKRSELDKWIISLLNSLIKECTESFNDYEPTRAARAIQDFVGDNLSNWYVRLSRRRFWKSENSEDKLAAYQTLYMCLETVARLMAPVSPFMSDWLFRNLNTVTQRYDHVSVHLALFPIHDEKLIDKDLEESMHLAQEISSTVLSLRKKENIKVRQPLSKIMIPVLNENVRHQIEHVDDLIRSEVNIKKIEFISDSEGIITKKIKPNFKTLGPKLGADMKIVAATISSFSQQQIAELEQTGKAEVAVSDRAVEI